MSRYYELRAARESQYTGDIHFGPRWRLAGVRCPACGITASGGFISYPSVDLSACVFQTEYEVSRLETPEEFARLREQLRPHAPPGALLPPGAWLGPLRGVAVGFFGSFFLHSLWTRLSRAAALEPLRAEGVRGLRGFPTQLGIASETPNDLLELEVLSAGRLHPECHPARAPVCPRCGLAPLRYPDEPVLDAASLPTDTDLFVLSDFETILIGTERFVDAVRRLGLDDIDIRELPIR